MPITTLLRFLIGDRQAILVIAGNRHALWIGFLFVLSAGFAREYDGEDLLHEPWHALLPVAASLASSLVLFTLAYGVAVCKGAPGQNFLPNYARFLGLFWMTAPLAWLYAVPYEAFLSPSEAMRANLWTLGLVSVWRVALMTRVLMVVLGYSLAASLCLVMLFADAIALTLLWTLPIPLMDVMGGIRLVERDRILRNLACFVFQVGGCSLPIWLVGAAIAVARSQPAWQVPSSQGRSGWLGWVALASVLVWAAVLPLTQPQQVRKREVEQMFAQKRIAEALAEMSRHSRSDYPPGWEPPPRQFVQFDSEDDTIPVLEEMAREEPAAWVRDLYLDRLPQMIGHGHNLQEPHLERIAAALERLPGGQAVIERLDKLGYDYPARELRKEMKRLERDRPAKD